MTKLAFVTAIAFAFSGVAPLAQADSINVAVYSNFQPVGGGAPYSGLVGAFTAPDIQFGTDFNDEWAPYGLTRFGADLTAWLNASATGVYRISMTSDDGSEVFVDGTLVLQDPGYHAPGLVFTNLSLTQGQHYLEVQYFQGACCAAALDLNLPAGLSYLELPEPSPQVLFSLGMLMLFAKLGYQAFQQRKRVR